MPGSDHGPSIKCPDIYEALRRQGMTKEKAARISNAACKKRGMKSAETLDLTPDEQSEIWRLVGLVWAELFPDEQLPDFAKTAAEPTCKKEGDSGCFPKGDYAYTPGDTPFTWKLRLTKTPGGDPDAGIVGAAIAALGKGFRGSKVAIPDDDLPGVTERVRNAWRKANPDKDDDEMPDVIVKKASEFDEKRSPDYLSKMIAWFRSQFGKDFDEDEYKAAHRSAMGHAGGKATARKRREEKVAAEAIYDHLTEHPEPVESCAFCGDYYQGPMVPVIKMLKADDRVNYRDAEDDGETPIRCYNCRFYEWGACKLVEGSIEADDVCDLFMPPVKTVPDPAPSLYAAAEKGSSWALFMELPEQFADVPESVNVLPVPGVYDHRLYGKIVVTPERNARFVQNFENRVYQQDLPITLDIEHDGKMSGAVGTIDALELNEDGSVDAKITWTDRGQTMIAEDAFKYFSPEWMDSWRDPATGTEFDDVLIGGALTVRPFFKESALRPLVASEMALFAPEGGSGTSEPTVIMLRPLVATEYRRESTTMGVEVTEEQLKEFTELKDRAPQIEEALKQANERVEALEKKNRTSRFTEIVRGRAEGSDGAAWVGEIQANVESLERLAEAFGEDSDQFKAEVKFRSDLATANKSSAIFKPVGTPEGGDVDAGPIEEVDRRAKELVAAEPTLSRSDAVGRIFREDPNLYAQYNRATRARDDD